MQVIELEIEKIVVGDLRCNCYIVKKNHKCLIIDPGDNALEIKNACQDYQCEEILVTHHHFDHVGALKELEEFYHVRHNEFLRKTFQYEVIKTPGHASDCLTFYFRDEKVMFTGNVINLRKMDLKNLSFLIQLK